MAKQTTWYRLDPADMLIEALDCTPKEWYKRTLVMMKALVKGERGRDDFADKLMDDAESYVAQRRNAGRRGGNARVANAFRRSSENQAELVSRSSETKAAGKSRSSEGARPACLTRASTEPTVPTVPTEPIVPTEAIRVAATTTRATAEREAAVGLSGHSPQEGRRPSDFGRQAADSLASVNSANDALRRKPDTPAFDWAAYDADPYGYLASVPHQRLPDFAAWFCHEPGNAEARKRYGAFCKAKGWLRFRGLLESFIGECKSGEDPDNRGAALTKRVMEAWS